MRRSRVLFLGVVCVWLGLAWACDSDGKTDLDPANDGESSADTEGDGDTVELETTEVTRCEDGDASEGNAENADGLPVCRDFCKGTLAYVCRNDLLTPGDTCLTYLVTDCAPYHRDCRLDGIKATCDARPVTCSLPCCSDNVAFNTDDNGSNPKTSTVDCGPLGKICSARAYPIVSCVDP